MKTTSRIGTIGLVFLLGMAVGVQAARKKGAEPDLYRDQEPQAAAANLVAAAAAIEDGSWETIAIGRLHYLSGDKEKGRQIFDSVLQGKKEAGSDWIRVGRVYYDAGDWELAKAAFDRALELEPKDAPWMAEIGAYYNVQGERAKAEEYFDRSLAIENGSYWPLLDIAGSYAGVAPKR